MIKLDLYTKSKIERVAGCESHPLRSHANYLLTSGCSAVYRHRRHDIRHRPIHDLFLDGLH